MARLWDKYKNQIQKELKESLKLKNIMQVPRLDKIVLNIGCGRASQDKSIIDDAEKVLAKITGQKPERCKAKNAVAGFKLREGQPVGCKVTLRGNIMYEFLDRLINIAMPSVKDFRGIHRKLDGRGGYALGWKDHSIFPEINFDDVKNTFGMDICFVTTANTDDAGFALLEKLGLPFKKNKLGGISG